MQCFQIPSFPCGWIVVLASDFDETQLIPFHVLGCVRFEEPDCGHWSPCYFQEALLIWSWTELWVSANMSISCNPHIYNQPPYSSHLRLSVSDGLLLEYIILHSVCKRAYIHDGFCSSHFFFLERQVIQPVLVLWLNARFLFGCS
jgi:hypothetical protein